jgi:hypothetical protein
MLAVTIHGGASVFTAGVGVVVWFITFAVCNWATHLSSERRGV